MLDRSGTWISYGDVKLGQGREKARAYLTENRELLDEIMGKVKEARGAHSAVVETNGQEDEDDEDDEEDE